MSALALIFWRCTSFTSGLWPKVWSLEAKIEMYPCLKPKMVKLRSMVGCFMIKAPKYTKIRPLALIFGFVNEYRSHFVFVRILGVCFGVLWWCVSCPCSALSPGDAGELPSYSCCWWQSYLLPITDWLFKLRAPVQQIVLSVLWQTWTQIWFTWDRSIDRSIFIYIKF